MSSINFSRGRLSEPVSELDSDLSSPSAGALAVGSRPHYPSAVAVLSLVGLSAALVFKVVKKRGNSKSKITGAEKKAAVSPPPADGVPLVSVDLFRNSDKSQSPAAVASAAGDDLNFVSRFRADIEECLVEFKAANGPTTTRRLQVMSDRCRKSLFLVFVMSGVAAVSLFVRAAFNPRLRPEDYEITRDLGLIGACVVMLGYIIIHLQDAWNGSYSCTPRQTEAFDTSQAQLQQSLDESSKGKDDVNLVNVKSGVAGNTQPNGPVWSIALPGSNSFIVEPVDHPDDFFKVSATSLQRL
eukprot:GHVT01039520.1.p1 GENE.GHVT01039520.1~~GHVT01039520.1.p1  ORF type:complete len:298 (+),score=41.21 GHVT01039520.1:382-1275(+)